MAHKLGDTIIPTEVGDFYANWMPGAPVVTTRDSEETAPDWNKVRRGRPLPAGGKSSAQMAQEGWVGLYLTTPKDPPAGAVKVAWFQEPSA
ncbi:MAG: hypothetical protein K2W95_15160 [Candidatus Obscuribacterales bacterium]|nr:hypothetical protein [Candidatus Obscuribacterales bacterium]